MATQFLETYPDIGLDIFHEVAHVRGAIDVRQGTGYEDFSGAV
jgi:hypothetical protein